MNQRTDQNAEHTRPFAAPCRRLPVAAPLRWLAAGWSDYRASPGISLAYGSIVFAVSLGVTLLAWKLGSYVLVISMLSGFIFIAPLLATGMYSASRQLGRGEPVSFARSVRRMQFALRDALVFALVLLVIFLVWVRAGVMVHVFFPAGESHDPLLLLRFLGIGSAGGAIFDEADAEFALRRYRELAASYRAVEFQEVMSSIGVEPTNDPLSIVSKGEPRRGRVEVSKNLEEA
jgi:hypothetical protein